MNSTQGQSVTFTATVTSNTSTGNPTGTVIFLDSATQIGSANLSGGMAKFSTSSLAVGTHTITAQYNGDSNFTGSTSAGITQNIAAAQQGFTISASPSSASVRTGKIASFTVTVTPTGGFTGSVTLTTSWSGPTPTFSANPVTGGSGSSTMKVSTSGVKSGTYTITITGTSGNLTNQTQVTLRVH
ncbi:MAG: hypothetical protein DMG93_22435 [Acidobacteria bacterium]|nr:MAG: hypothetical protein DMG93_22435 [Acidobacteriota bacterium]